jgi:hypothetical protein
MVPVDQVGEYVIRSDVFSRVVSHYHYLSFYLFISLLYLSTRLSQNLSATSLAAAAEMAVGAGAGLLLADQLGKGARQRLGIIALVAGLAATVPLLIGAGVRVNRELGEGRRTRRRLETIRHDSGFPEDGDFY